MPRLIDLGLARLRELIYMMHSMVKEAFKHTRRCLSNISECDPETIRPLSRKIIELRDEAVALAAEIIARYQPVARDLRLVISSMEVSYDLFRITRYLSETMRIVGVAGLSDCRFEQALALLDKVEVMVELAVSAYTSTDVEKAKKVIELDNTIDEAYLSTVKQLLSRECITSCSAVELLILRHWERIADHASYMAISAYYVATGNRLEH
ncbi:MAG: hypothetical protein GXO09_05820 [Crenarchaeota archaeon]|nr:hypothetical protein [Thermoproteota archaeon]